METGWRPNAFSATRDNQPRMILAVPSSGGGQPNAPRFRSIQRARQRLVARRRRPRLDQFDPASGGKIRVIAADGSRTIETLTNTAFDNRGAVFSPDGRWLAYTSNESGRDEVYAQPYPGPGPKRRISVGGGQEPAWPRADSRIYFRGQDRMMSVDVRTSPTFVASTPSPLFVDKVRNRTQCRPKLRRLGRRAALSDVEDGAAVPACRTERCFELERHTNRESNDDSASITKVSGRGDLQPA